MRPPSQAYVQNIPESLCHEKANASAGFSNDGIGCNGSAVYHPTHLRRRRSGLAKYAPKAVHEALFKMGRRRGDFLYDPVLAVTISQEYISECSAYIYAYGDHGYLRLYCVQELLPFIIVVIYTNDVYLVKHKKSAIVVNVYIYIVKCLQNDI
ncbi:hypothetical protein GCM10027297_06500 [Parahaliea aestuarii]